MLRHSEHLHETLRFEIHLLCDGGSSHDAPLNHLLGDLVGHHAAGLRVLRGHQRPFCWGRAAV